MAVLVGFKRVTFKFWYATHPISRLSRLITRHHRFITPQTIFLLVSSNFTLYQRVNAGQSLAAGKENFVSTNTFCMPSSRFSNA